MLISNNKQRGFSMIEVLVSLLVIGIGLLGLSGLQIASIKGASNAHSRNVAGMIAFELGERMRANPAGVDGGFYSNTDTCSTNLNQCRGSVCSAKQIARLDVQEVMCGVKKLTKREGGALNLLPNGTVSVTCTGGCNQVDALHDVTVSWSNLNTHKDQSGSSSTESIIVSILP